MSKINAASLANFYGTSGHYRWSNLFRNYLLTDGTKFVAEKCEAFWLMDAIASYCAKLRKMSNVDFLVWELTKKDNGAVLTARRDSGQKPIIKQNIEFTDFFDKFEEDTFTCWQESTVLLLPSEH